jgi:hypothetical protein
VASIDAMHASIGVEWRPRAVPLAPLAVVAVGARARSLAERLLGDSDEILSGLRGVAGPGCVIAMGEGLPWVDGVLYLGRDPDAPSLLLPTNLLPSVPAALLERALVAKSRMSPPLAVLPDPPRIASLAKALPIVRGMLELWLKSGT